MSVLTPTDSAERNITAAFDFATAILDDPSLLDTVPDGATVVFLPDDDPAMLESNLRLGDNATRNGANVYFIHVPTFASHT